jgi:hypothetical protein
MTLILKKGLRLRNAWQPMDPDAAAYITAVEAADGQALEERVKIAIDNFVLGCKADGIWNAIKASCILAGARTLAGALVPLVGAAPTSHGTEGGWDYGRKTGLRANGTNNYLNSNRAGNLDPSTNSHISIYITSLQGFFYMGSNGPTSANQLTNSSGSGAVSFNGRQAGATLDAIGLYGATLTAGVLTTRRGQVDVTSTTSTGLTTPSANYFVFARNLDGTPSGFSSARLAFYSIGESLDLALLDARVTALVNALAVAIP